LFALTGALVVAPSAVARDPGRWVDTGFSRFVVSYNQGITVDPSRNLYFDGALLSFNGLFRTNDHLQQNAAASPEIPAAVTASDGFNHIGDLSWDPGEGGRVLLPLECFTPGGPNGGNTCGRGGFGVADPATLAWRYYVRLDPADIPKAMWVETSPDGKLVWTSAGNDLLAYNAADINPANAAPAGPVIKPVARLAGAVPPSGITGAAFTGGRLFLAGRSGKLFQVWSVDVGTGQKRLEIERSWTGEAEGMAVFTGLGGLLHAQLLPEIGAVPTFGAGHGALVHFAPAHTLKLRLAVSPRRTKVGNRTRFKFTVSFAGLGGSGPVKGATIKLAGHRAVTDRKGRARFAAVLPHKGVFVARAVKRGFKNGTATVGGR
jgi:hypothetical protein